MTTDTKANVALVETMIANGLSGNYDAIRQHIADDYVCHMPDGLPFGGVHHGWDGYTRIFAKMLEFFSDIAFGPNEYVGHGDDVLVVSQLKGVVRKSGRAVEMPIIEVWTVKNGMIVAIRPYYFDTKTLSDLEQG